MIRLLWSELTRFEDKLPTLQPGTKAYGDALEQISTIQDIQDRFYERVEQPWYIEIVKSPAFIGGMFQIVATVIVVNHEKIHIITSKAFNFIRMR